MCVDVSGGWQGVRRVLIISEVAVKRNFNDTRADCVGVSKVSVLRSL